MTTPLPDDPDDIRSVAAAVLGIAPVSVSRVPSFAGNRVFRVARPSGQPAAFFKFGSSTDIEREHHALILAAGIGVPVPLIEAADLNNRWSPHPLLVVGEVDGSPLDGSEPVYSQVAVLLSRCHRVTLEGFGTATVDGSRLRGEDATWPSALIRRAASASAAASAGLVPAELVERVVNAVERLHGLLTTHSGRLLHGDFHPRHVYANDTTITAVIDWGDATVGDPDYDFARVLHAGVLRGGLDAAVANVTALLSPAESDLDRPRLAKLFTYAAVFVCWSMAGEFEGGAPWPPWWPAQAAALTRLLDSLDELR